MKLPSGPLALLRRLGKIVTQYEKVLLALLSVVIIISGTFWYKQYAASNDVSQTPGGTYIDGIVGGSEEIQTIASKLTKSGLFTFDNEGNLVNQLIEDWRVNPEKTEYTFDLLPNIDGELIQFELEQNLDLIGPASVSVEGQVLTLTLTQANPNIPFLLAQPIFDYGPYKLSKMTNNTAIFIRSATSEATEAYINKVVVHTFTTEEELREALRRKRIDGASGLGNVDLPHGYELKEFMLPRYYAVLLNVNRAPFREANKRTALINGQSVPSEAFKLTTPNKEPYLTYANQVVETWRQLGAKVEIDARPLEEITSKVAPSRDFQALLAGIDYGAELDPYYLWHSSQVRPPGNNLVGLRSEQVDSKIAAIQAEYNPGKRKTQIEELHQLLKEQGVASILIQEKETLILSHKVYYREPVLPVTSRDRWLAIPKWSIK